MKVEKTEETRSIFITWCNSGYCYISYKNNNITFKSIAL